MATACSSSTGTSSGGNDFPQPDTAPPISVIIDESATVAFVYRPMLDEIQTYWNNVYSAMSSGQISTNVTGDFLMTGDSANCSGEQLDWDNGLGPIYCVTTDNIVVAVSMTKKLVEKGDAVVLDSGEFKLTPAGEVGVFAMIAHEFGHNIQNEFFGPTLHARLGATKPVALENSADCLAGVAIAGVDRVFSEKDALTIVNLFAEIGQPIPVNHGTPQQRVDALVAGMNFPYGMQGGQNGLVYCLQTYLPDEFNGVASS